VLNFEFAGVSSGAQQAARGISGRLDIRYLPFLVLAFRRRTAELRKPRIAVGPNLSWSWKSARSLIGEQEWSIPYQRSSAGRNISTTATPKRPKIGIRGRFGSTINRARTAPPSRLATDQAAYFNRALRRFFIVNNVLRVNCRLHRLVSENHRPVAVAPTSFRSPSGRPVSNEEVIGELIGFEQFGPHCASLLVIPSSVADARTGDAVVRAPIASTVPASVSQNRYSAVDIQSDPHMGQFLSHQNAACDLPRKCDSLLDTNCLHR
jgi:hypothetical protein